MSVIPYSLNFSHKELSFFEIATKMLGKTFQLKCRYNADESMFKFDVVDLKSLYLWIIFRGILKKK